MQRGRGKKEDDWRTEKLFKEMLWCSEVDSGYMCDKYWQCPLKMQTGKIMTCTYCVLKFWHDLTISRAAPSCLWQTKQKWLVFLHSFVSQKTGGNHSLLENIYCSCQTEWRMVTAATECTCQLPCSTSDVMKAFTTFCVWCSSTDNGRSHVCGMMRPEESSGWA